LAAFPDAGPGRGSPHGPTEPGS